MGHFCPPASGSGYGSRDPIESGSNPYSDTDPQHCVPGTGMDFLRFVCFLTSYDTYGTLSYQCEDTVTE